MGENIIVPYGNEREQSVVSAAFSPDGSRIVTAAVMALIAHLRRRGS